MKPPTKVKELQMFLGFVNYFASYIPIYTWITRPQYRRLAKDTSWARDSIHQETYDLSKLSLKSTPVLGHPQDRKGYRLYTDASNFGIGAVLRQASKPSSIRRTSTPTGHNSRQRRKATRNGVLAWQFRGNRSLHRKGHRLLVPTPQIR